MIAIACAGGAFLFAVLWFDLMFDIQVRGHGDGDLPDDVLVSIAAYYRRVTTAARPMNRLIGAVMVITLAAIVAQIAEGDSPRWIAWASLVLAAAPILLAGTRTFPSAVRLGGRGDAVIAQSELARSIYRDHVVCAASIAALLALQLSQA